MFLQRIFSPRLIMLTMFTLASLLFLMLLVGAPTSLVYFAGFAISAAFVVLGVSDLMQTKHAVLRNYPISAHLRFLLEEIRPEMRQYFFESEKDGMPFPRDTRAVVYQRAKMVLDKRPFGTQEDVYREGYEWMHHSMAPKPHADGIFRITIGGRGLHQAVFGVGVQYLGDELWRAQPQCRPRAERGRQEGRLCA